MTSDIHQEHFANMYGARPLSLVVELVTKRRVTHWGHVSTSREISRAIMLIMPIVFGLDA